MIDKDAIIQNVAKKHHVLLGQNDPILVTVTIMEEVFNTYLAEVEKSVNRTNEGMEDISFQYMEQSKKLAQNIVGAAINDISAKIREEGMEATRLFSEELNKQRAIDDKRISTIKNGVYVAAGLSVFCFLGAFVFVALAYS